MEWEPSAVTIETQLDAAESDALKVVAGLGEVRGTWHLTSRAWSVAECLDQPVREHRERSQSILR